MSPSPTIQTPVLERALALRGDGALLGLARRRCRRRRPPSPPPEVAIVTTTRRKAATRATHGEDPGDLVRLRLRHRGARWYPRRAIGGPRPTVSRRPGPRAPRAAPRPPPRGRRPRRCCAPPRPGSRPGGRARAPGPGPPGCPPWAPTPGIRKIESGISSRRRARCSGAVAPTTAPIPLSPSAPASRGARSATSAASCSCSGRPSTIGVLEVGGARVRGPDQREDAGAGLGGRVDERLERVAAQQRVGGEGVGAEAGDRAPGRLGPPDQRLRVGGAR